MYLSLARNTPGWSSKLKVTMQSQLWKRREIRLTRKFSGLGVCSETDRTYLGNQPSIHVIPNGFPRPEQAPRRQPASIPTIGFIGKMDYPPNSEGIDWFIDQVWPIVRRRHPPARLRLIGSGTREKVSDRGDGIEGLGYLEDPTKEMATWSCMIVPVLVGGGTRVKIAEAFSRKCPIVTTSLGCYGYDVADSKELLIADTAEAFAQACIRLLCFPQEATAISERAWKKFLENWTWEAISPRVSAAVEYCLRGVPTIGDMEPIADRRKGANL